MQHVNAFAFERVDRFYTVQPANADVRGWVGHRRDWKWFFAAKGRFTIALVKPDDWTHPSRALTAERYELAEGSPAVLEVPPGYVTASRMTEAASVLLIFSSGRIEDAGSDDFRYPADYWPLGGE